MSFENADLNLLLDDNFDSTLKGGNSPIYDNCAEVSTTPQQPTTKTQGGLDMPSIETIKPLEPKQMISPPAPVSSSYSSIDIKEDYERVNGGKMCCKRGYSVMCWISLILIIIVIALVISYLVKNGHMDKLINCMSSDGNGKRKIIIADSIAPFNNVAPSYSNINGLSRCNTRLMRPMQYIEQNARTYDPRLQTCGGRGGIEIEGVRNIPVSTSDFL